MSLRSRLLLALLALVFSTPAWVFGERAAGHDDDAIEHGHEGDDDDGCDADDLSSATRGPAAPFADNLPQPAGLGRTPRDGR